MKIAIVSSGESAEVKELLQLAAGFTDIECTHLSVSDPNLATLDADVVYWRSAGVTKYFKKAMGRTVVLKRLQQTVKVVNEALVDTPNLTNKSYQQVHLATTLPQVRGIESFLARDIESLLQLFTDGVLTYPCIAKPDQGSQGKGVTLLQSEADVTQLTDVNSYVYQNYIPNDCDYRIFVVGGVAIDVVRRRATSESTKSYLNNISQGGQVEKVDDIKLYYKLAKKAERIAAAFELTVCGVDLIQNNETGDIYFMEINTAPQWVMFKDALRVNVGERVLETLRDAGSSDRFSVDDIAPYYERHVDTIEPGKGFHFLSRMYLWTNEQRYRAQLDAIRDSWLPDVNVQLNLAKRIPTLQPPKRGGGRKYRKEHYVHHYKIYKYNLLFFKALFLKTIYNDPRSEEIIAAIDRADVDATREALLADPAAIYALATHAVNFLYHYAHFFKQSLHPKLFIEIAKTNSLPNPADDAEARSYMFTHAVIGASRFYAKRPVTDHVHVYTQMLREIEETILNNFTNVSLDVKCEFLVCARIINYESELAEAIKQEVESSRSPHGNFIVDTLNSDKDMAYKKGFQTSEHRNVLAVMAFDKKAT